MWPSNKILDYLKPENKLEFDLIETSDFQKGLLWGEPRYGHPEGKVIFHVREIYENIEQLKIDDHMRRQLRIIALCHDTFKYQESKSTPRDWYYHHGNIAARFAEKYISEPAILQTIALHDEAYYCWKTEQSDDIGAQKRFDKLLQQIDNHLQLYYLFFKCDTTTGDKIMAPLKWFEKKKLEIDIVSLK